MKIRRELLENQKRNAFSAELLSKLCYLVNQDVDLTGLEEACLKPLIKYGLSEFQAAILHIECTQRFCHNVRMGIICSAFLRGRKIFSNVFQK